MTRRDELLAELERQQTIHARQVEQFTNARPRARFAYASHLTKTRNRIARLEVEIARCSS